jgi:hypothetical protein
MKVYFDEESNGNKKENSWIFHYGIFSDENEKDFDFSLLEMYDSNSDSSSFEITFCDEAPLDSIAAEKFILDEFSKIE